MSRSDVPELKDRAAMSKRGAVQKNALLSTRLLAGTVQAIRSFPAHPARAVTLKLDCLTLRRLPKWFPEAVEDENVDQRSVQQSSKARFLHLTAELRSFLEEKLHSGPFCPWRPDLETFGTVSQRILVCLACIEQSGITGLADFLQTLPGAMASSGRRTMPQPSLLHLTFPVRPFLVRLERGKSKQ